MRKTVIITLLLLLLSSLCMANPDIDRWTPVSIDSDVRMYYDNTTVRYNDERTECEVWMLVAMPSKEMFTINRLSVKSNRTIKFKEVFTYNIHTKEMIESDMREDERYAPIVPASRLEMLHNLLFPNK